MFEADSSSSGISASSASAARQQEKKPSHDPNGGCSPSTEEKESRPEQINKLSSTGSEESRKNQKQKICGVCGDIAKSFHFGGLSCDSCKAFFRRAVHNDSNTAFRCAYDSHCVVDKGSRKGCQYCRFQKCLTIGMETKWVMGEEERNQLKQHQQVQKKDKKDVTTESEYEPDVADMLKFMIPAEKDEIECIVNKYQHSYREIPFKVSHCQGSRNTIEIIQMFTTILRRFAYFTKLLPEFTELSIPDQSTLLRASVLEMCLLRGALSFDLKNNRWPATEKLTFLKDCPQLRVEDMEKLVSKDLYDMHMQFITGIQELGADEPTVMILLLVVLFYPERGTLENQHYISSVQEKYLMLLKKYVEWRYGPKGAKTFPKLLSKLADLRQLNDSHTEYNLRMTKTEVERIQEQLGNLNLNPYPQWVLVEDQLKAQAQAQEAHRLAHAQAAMATEAQPPPQPRDFFKQFVNRKIPALVNNPFTQFPIENELAYARSFFQQNPQFAQQAQAHQMSQPEARHMDMHYGEMSQFKNILESTDPNALRQLKDQLSPNVLAKLQSVFGQGQSGEVRIPQEVMTFMNQSGGQYQNLMSGQVGYQEMNHPMAQFNQTQLSDHFSTLQQQFRNPNFYYEAPAHASGQEMYYHLQPQGSTDYAQQQQHYVQQQHQQYQNW